MSIIGNKSCRGLPSNRDDEEHTDNLRLKPTSDVNNVASTNQRKLKQNNKKNGGHKTSKASDPDQNKTNEKRKPKKSFVRNSEVPLPGGSTVSCPVRKGILKNPVITIDGKPEGKVGESRTSAYESRYSTPELYSSLSTAKKISATKLEKMQLHCEGSFADKQLMGEKAASRLNFPLEEQVYRDLVALNVTDDDLLKEAEKHAVREFESTRKEKEPKLEDFYQPKSGIEYGSITKPLLCPIEKVRRYNGHSVYNKSLLWENLAQQ